ncbi:hypothetical protein [Sphingomonas faeni]|uniref:hypothetical protein n=1 Tax=Sphingomonas faeni TaxID=185950 RepID=UPI002783AE80|nr:hypothetical protein [Sphingomonas faeni]MDQ0839393.1 hypothetical protein [Sphingomonas faeni]
MATQAHSIAPRAAATTHRAIVSSAMTAGSSSACWTADPRAIKLLDSCAALPPALLEQRSRYGNAVDKWTAFAGYRVEALEAIRMELGDRLLQAHMQHGDAAYEPFRQWCDQPTASDAVAALFVSSTEH